MTNTITTFTYTTYHYPKDSPQCDPLSLCWSPNEALRIDIVGNGIPSVHASKHISSVPHIGSSNHVESCFQILPFAQPTQDRGGVSCE